MVLSDKLRRFLPGRKQEREREPATSVDAVQIYDAEAFVAQGLGTFVEKKSFQPLLSNAGFTDIQSGEFYRLKSYTPATRSLLRIASADIYFPNVVITNNALLNINNGYTSTERLRQRALVSPLQQVGGRLTIKPATAVVRTEAGCYLAADDNYSAWLLGEIPRIENYLRNGGTSAQIILHGKARQFHLDSLAAYGIGPDRIVTIAPHAKISARDILFATPGYFHHIPSPDAVDFLAGIARDPPGIADERPAPRKIYISRSRTRMRKIRNEADLERTLQDEGYEIVFPEERTFTEQAAIFQSADIIVAPFGAALANLVYVKPSCRTVLITTKFTLEFARLLQMRGINFFVFNGLARNWLRYLVPRRIRERYSQYTVNIESLTAGLRRLVSGNIKSRNNGTIYTSHRQFRRR
jgi:capsular polysaccharide biosynthesis protein